MDDESDFEHQMTSWSCDNDSEMLSGDCQRRRQIGHIWATDAGPWDFKFFYFCTFSYCDTVCTKHSEHFVDYLQLDYTTL